MDRRLGWCMAWCIVSPVALLSAPAVRAQAEAAASASPLAPSPAGRFTLELRPRYNRLDESDVEERGGGGTVRAAAGWVSAPWHAMRLTVEGIHTDQFGAKRYNDDPTAPSNYPLLPDPRYTGVNRLFADVDAPGATRIRVGRQVVRLGNQRWVSDDDFRQLPVVFDGISAVSRAIDGVELSAGTFRRERTSLGDLDRLRLHLFEAAWNPAPDQAVSLYGVFHDAPQNGAFTGFADNSYRVLGLRAEGTAARWNVLRLDYTAEYAVQRPYAGGDARVRADYWRLGTGIGTRAWSVRYDYEVKGSNHGIYGLQTPLTDFYAYNGWTLHFFNTPPAGLRDQWASGRWAWRSLTLYGEVHGFRSDAGNLDFGRELDVAAAWQVRPDLVARLQHARYDPGNAGNTSTVRKTWLTLTYTY